MILRNQGRFSRREFLKLSAVGVSSLSLSGLFQWNKALAGEAPAPMINLESKPVLRVLRWMGFVRSDEEIWMSNTARWECETGGKVIIDFTFLCLPFQCGASGYLASISGLTENPLHSKKLITGKRERGGKKRLQSLSILLNLKGNAVSRMIRDYRRWRPLRVPNPTFKAGLPGAGQVCVRL